MSIMQTPGSDQAHIFSIVFDHANNVVSIEATYPEDVIPGGPAKSSRYDTPSGWTPEISEKVQDLIATAQELVVAIDESYGARPTTISSGGGRADT